MKQLVLLFSLIILTACQSKEKWISTVDMDTSLHYKKETVSIDNALALKLVQNEKGGVSENWKALIGEKIKPSPSEKPLSEKTEKSMRKGTGKTSFLITAYSDTLIDVKIVSHLGNYLWHHLYKVEASLRLKRSPKVDKLFNLNYEELTYGRVYKDLRQGSTQEQVLQVLGKADTARTTQALGYEDWDYPKHQLHIYFEYGKIKSFSMDLNKVK